MFCLFFLDHTDNKVNGPTLPINIVTIRTILLYGVNNGVIPNDEPTVANALTDSNNNFDKSIVGSKKHNNVVQQVTTIDAKNKIINDLLICSDVISLLKLKQWLFIHVDLVPFIKT